MKAELICLLAVFAVALAYSPEIKKVEGGRSGDGITTRYWDCCKPSCSWTDNIKTPDMIPVASCAADGVTVVDQTVQSGCGDGSSYMCNDQQPFVVNETLGYGFTAVSFAGGAETADCCSCYLLSFSADALKDKNLVLQFTNTGGDLGANQFDIALPGGGVGLFNGCDSQWNSGPDGWGDRYGGVHTREECLSLLPEQLQPGCLFRFDFLMGEDNPTMHFEQVECPAELVAISGCNLPL